MTDLASEIPPQARRKPLTGIVYRDFNRYAVITHGSRNYLEIGVRSGLSLEQIDVPSIGVDPNFVLNREPMGKKPALYLFQQTSDDFFRDHDPKALFGAPVDAAFLDGMHLFEFLLRDFMNTERASHPRGLVLMDDCLPVNIEMTEREHRPELRVDKSIAGWWTGDVWKVVTILREYRPDLRITPVDVRPTGSVLVTRLDPTSTVLWDHYDEIVERFQDVEFTPESFDAYWAENAPISVVEVITGFEARLFGP